MKKLILYGAGTVGKSMAIELKFRGIPIECFCDSDKSKCGKNLVGYMVRSIDEIKHMYTEGTFLLLLTLGSKTAAAVKQDFINRGIFTECDFYNEIQDFHHIMPLFMITSPDYDFPCVIAQELSINFRRLSSGAEKTVERGLLSHYYCVDSVEDLTSDHLKSDFFDHLYGRLNMDRKKVIPWLDDIHKLNGASVLEIGSGTGASTVALCEQGAIVTAIDADLNSLEVSKIRLDAYGLNADVMHINAADILDIFADKRFDLIIYFASLEHMTFHERIKSLQAAFEMLTVDGHVVLVEIPNRLWFLDLHTSHEPFYNWLPDDLAMEYSRFTLREGYNLGFDLSDEQDMIRFARWGRGVSYHELEIALGDRNRIHVTSSMGKYWNFPDSVFKKFLKMCGPQDLHEGFYEPYLYIALKRQDNATEKGNCCT